MSHAGLASIVLHYDRVPLDSARWLNFFPRITVTGLFCYRMQQEGITERSSEPIYNLQMRPTVRRYRNAQGEFVAAAEELVAAAENQVPANADVQIESPDKNKTDFGALVTLKKWQIAITPDRTQACLWSFLVITNFLCILSIIFFWVCIIMCIKTFPVWNGPIHIFEGFMRRRNIIAGGNQVDPEDNFWEDLFPRMESLEAYTLKILLTETGRIGSPTILGLQIPLLFKHPLVWACLMLLAFLEYCFLSFIYGCLKRAYRAITIHIRRRSA